MKQFYFIKSTMGKNGMYLVLWQTGNYQYQIDVKNDSYKKIAVVDGTCQDAINVMESLAVL
jgi:hypothetical protein